MKVVFSLCVLLVALLCFLFGVEEGNGWVFGFGCILAYGGYKTLTS
jgi:hypothetical protein